MTSEVRPTVSAAVPGKLRLDFVDVLRALAVTGVFALHARAYWVAPVEGVSVAFVLDRVVAQGAAGVDLFIVLSGFCMTYPLLRGRLHGIATVDPLRFYKRRAIRLLPAYYAALALVLALEQVPVLRERMVAGPPDLQAVVAHVLLVQPFHSDTIGAINGPLWSISLEVTLYLVFPLVLALLVRYGWLVITVGSVCLALSWFLLAEVVDRTLPGNPWLSEMTYWLPAHHFEFVLGMLAAEMVCRPRSHQTLICGLAILPLAAIGSLGTIADLDVARTFGWGLAAFALTVAMSGVADRRHFQRVVPVFAKLGLVSYSFYLLHQPAILLVAPEVRGLGLSAVALYLLGVPIGIVLMATCAWAFFRAAERPFLLAGGMRDAIRRDAEVSPADGGDQIASGAPTGSESVTKLPGT